MNNVIIIGGGLSGLTSAFYLSQKKYNITIIESSPKLGGRTYSIYNESQNEFYDNGHHLMMGCYHDTLKLIKDLKTFDKIEIQERLEVNFIDENSLNYKLKSANIFYPLNLLLAILNYNAISFKERLRIIDFMFDIACCFKEDLENMTVLEWLMLKNQNDETINKFWEILVVGIMNCSPEKASALIFNNVLREIFYTGKNSSKFILTKFGLAEIFINPIKNFVVENHNEILLNERVEKLVIQKNSVKKIITNKKIYEAFDYVIFAIPPYSYSRIRFYDEKGREFYPLSQMLSKEFHYSPILNIHIWLKENIFDKKFYGLLNSEVDWLFNQGKHISITKSNAENLINLDKNIIMDLIYSDLKNYFPNFSKEKVIDFKVIKEKRATFISDITSNKLRNKIKSEFENLIFAGDWMTMEFPATIEGAIRSGKNAAQHIDNKLASN